MFLSTRRGPPAPMKGKIFFPVTSLFQLLLLWSASATCCEWLLQQNLLRGSFSSTFFAHAKKSSFFRAGLSYGCLSAGSDIMSQLLCEKKKLRHFSFLRKDMPGTAPGGDSHAAKSKTNYFIPTTSCVSKQRTLVLEQKMDNIMDLSNFNSSNYYDPIPPSASRRSTSPCTVASATDGSMTLDRKEPTIPGGKLYSTNLSRVLSTAPGTILANKGGWKGKRGVVECEGRRDAMPGAFTWTTPTSASAASSFLYLGGSSTGAATGAVSPSPPISCATASPAISTSLAAVKEKEFDVSRTLRWGFIGASLTGPYYKAAYEMVEKFWKSEAFVGLNKNLKLQLLLKNLSQQLIINPVFLAIFFTYSSIVEDFCKSDYEKERIGSSGFESLFSLSNTCSEKIDDKLQNVWPEACLKAMVFWGFVDLITYQLPVGNRVYFASACGAVWTTFLSFLDNKKNNEVEVCNSAGSQLPVIEAVLPGKPLRGGDLYGKSLQDHEDPLQQLKRIKGLEMKLRQDVVMESTTKSSSLSFLRTATPRTERGEQEQEGDHGKAKELDDSTRTFTSSRLSPAHLDTLRDHHSAPSEFSFFSKLHFWTEKEN
ncbi:unnamed protein product [Amoebophrya sp. A25]|nr:unnamed protein product [Amoebophrya sp. A25]|eukprot:GSA25T00011352001.1